MRARASSPGARTLAARGCTGRQDKVPEGVNLGRLVCVIDHHQLQANAVDVVEPRSVEIQPWGTSTRPCCQCAHAAHSSSACVARWTGRVETGSTATILAFKYVQHAIVLPPPIAGCLLLTR